MCIYKKYWSSTFPLSIYLPQQYVNNVLANLILQLKKLNIKQQVWGLKFLYKLKGYEMILNAHTETTRCVQVGFVEVRNI